MKHKQPKKPTEHQPRSDLQHLAHKLAMKYKTPKVHHGPATYEYDYHHDAEDPKVKMHIHVLSPQDLAHEPAMHVAHSSPKKSMDKRHKAFLRALRSALSASIAGRLAGAHGQHEIAAHAMVDDRPSYTSSAIIRPEDMHGGYEQFVNETIKLFQQRINKKYSLLFALEALATKESVAPGNVWMEFGVFSGSTSRLIRDRIQNFGINDTKLYSFDSFQGLPEKWVKGYDDSPPWDKGTFKNTEFPFQDPRVSWVKGWFNESLPVFLQSMDKSTKVTFVHIDADLYSSTHTVFENLAPYLSKDCILVFDDLLNFPLYRDGELKALWELMQKTGRSIEVVQAMGPDVHLIPPMTAKTTTAEKAIVRLL